MLPVAPVPTIAVYGDSLTDGLFLPLDTGARWTDQLEAQTDGRLVALNFGVAGDRITGPGARRPAAAAGGDRRLRAARRLRGHGRDGQQRHQGRRQRVGDPDRDPAAGGKGRRARHETFIVATVPGRGDGLTRRPGAAAPAAEPGAAPVPDRRRHRRRTDRSGHRNHPRRATTPATTSIRTRWASRR